MVRLNLIGRKCTYAGCTTTTQARAMVIQPHLLFLLFSNDVLVLGLGLESLAVQALIVFSP
jgi:hypothetical protein